MIDSPLFTQFMCVLLLVSFSCLNCMFIVIVKVRIYLFLILLFVYICQLDVLTCCRFASQFLVCATSAAFSICDVNPLQYFLSCARSVISARSLLECSLIGCRISARSLLNTIGNIAFGRPSSLFPLGIKQALVALFAKMSLPLPRI